MLELAPGDDDPVFWESVRDQLLVDVPDDPLRECYQDGFKIIMSDPDRFLGLANDKLHTFPFKDVKPCWFRLYTDASLAKVLNLIPSNPTSRLYRHLDELIAILDKALIMAGGLGREDLIQGILNRFQDCVKAERDEEEPPRKKRRVEAQHHGKTYAETLLHNANVSVPKLQFPVQQMDRPSLEVFSNFIQVERKPVVLNNILSHWPALEKWNRVKFWLETTLNGRRLVPIEVGRSYTDDDWGQKIVPFRDFLGHAILPSLANPGSETAKDELQSGYLAQHDIFRQIPMLRNDIATPDYCFLDAPLPEPGTPVARSRAKGEQAQDRTGGSQVTPSSGATIDLDDAIVEGDPEVSEVQTNIWFGPPWTISPLHHDPYHNILCQVVGKKHVRLYSPQYSEAVLPRSENQPAPHLVNQVGNETTSAAVEHRYGETIDMSNTSRVDVAAMETSPDEDWNELYPGISQVPYLECVLEAGQALYIPIGWWHYVRSCSVGISVSFWW